VKKCIKKLVNLLLFGLLVGLSSCKEGMCEGGMYLKCFDNSNELQPIDINNVHGYVGFRIKNIPQDANEILIYIDDVEIAEWVSYLMDEYRTFGFESNRFSNGPHKIKLKTTKTNGSEEYLIIDSKFNNLISSVSADEGFYPTEDYHYSGFNRDGNPLEVKLVNHNGEKLWSNTYRGNDVNVVIPGAAFRDEQLCRLLITDTVTGKNCAEDLWIDWKDEDFIGDQSSCFQRKIEEANQPK
jgi:hypothetical protein